MKVAYTLVFILSLAVFQPVSAQPIIINNDCRNVSQIPLEYLQKAQSEFRIGYGHTSHGSQIVSGMEVLRQQNAERYGFSTSGGGAGLSLRDRTPSADLGASGDTSWANRTRDYLRGAGSDRNMIMWSWCGGVSGNTVAGINAYLTAMTNLECDFPDVTFVYMTGHLDGTGEAGNLHQRNEQIRAYCRDNDKVLFDFTDLESYDPSGNYFLDKFADDGCNYVGQNGGTQNWADEWCEAHPNDCPMCSCAHSKSLNCYEKGKAFWWMMARLAGWDGETTGIHGDQFTPAMFNLYCIPNPVFNNAQIRADFHECGIADISLWNTAGEQVAMILEQQFVMLQRMELALPSGLQGGTYFLSARLNENVRTIRVVVQH